MGIATNSIETLKSTLDIVDIIGGYIELKKNGVNYKACCPFHGEKTPSLVVSPTKQIYKCFGCGVAGDSIKFVQDLKKIDFVSAIEEIANTLNFTLEYDTNHSKAPSYDEIMNRYQQMLTTQLSVAETEYLHGRGISEATILGWGIGYAPTTAKQKKIATDMLLLSAELVDAGIFAIDKDRVYSRFSERIMFPIYNMNNKLLGWSGRSLKDAPSKYLNSPQSKLFNKSQILFGIHKAKDTIYATGEMIIVEGHIDVIISHQHGFANTVGTQGTALTSEHILLIKKLKAKVRLVFDGDSAGRNAMLKASHMLSIAGIESYGAILPAGEDSASMLQSNQIEQYSEILAKAKSAESIVVNNIINSHDKSNPHELKKIVEELKEYLSLLDDTIAQVYMKKLNKFLGVDIVTHNTAVPTKPQVTITTTTEQAIFASIDRNLPLFALINHIPSEHWSDQESYALLSNAQHINIIVEEKTIMKEKELMRVIKSEYISYLSKKKKEYIVSQNFEAIRYIDDKLKKLS